MERGDTGATYSQHTLAGVLLTGTLDLGPPRTRLGASSEDCVDTELGVVGAVMRQWTISPDQWTNAWASPRQVWQQPRPDTGQIWAGVESGRGQDTHIWSPAATAVRHLL